MTLRQIRRDAAIFLSRKPRSLPPSRHPPRRRRLFSLQKSPRSSKSLLSKFPFRTAVFPSMAASSKYPGAATGPSAASALLPHRSLSAPDPQPSATGRLGGGRDLSKLLFVTDAKKLEKNIGETEAKRALRMISDGAKCILIDGTNPPETVVQRELAKGNHVGVVLVGGYDVVPSQRVDVLDAHLRASIPRDAILDDRDEFIVWSDDVWGDVDGENMPDFPVHTRIPDARSAELVLKALQASKPATASGRFGIRNTVRPFAAPIFDQLPPAPSSLLQSAPTRFDQIASGSRAAALSVFHVAWSRPRRFPFLGRQSRKGGRRGDQRGVFAKSGIGCCPSRMLLGSAYC